MKKNIKRINESQLRTIVAESVKKILNESDYPELMDYAMRCDNARLYWKQKKEREKEERRKEREAYFADKNHIPTVFPFPHKSHYPIEFFLDSNGNPLAHLTHNGNIVMKKDGITYIIRGEIKKNVTDHTIFADPQKKFEPTQIGYFTPEDFEKLLELIKGKRGDSN